MNAYQALNNPMAAHDRPRIWHLATVTGDAKTALDAWMTRANNLEHDDVADENTRQIMTSEPFDDGKTRSLHDLQTDDKQRFHIHLPHTPAGMTRDAGMLKDPASHRYLMVATGDKPGLFEWADAKGPLSVETENSVSVARGDVSHMGYRAVIPPHSIYCIELMGGIHHFHNIRGFSFHRENLPTQGSGDDLTLNTQQWHGKLPARFHDIIPSLIYPGIDDAQFVLAKPHLVGKPINLREPEVLNVFLERSENLLRDFTQNPQYCPVFDESVRSLTGALYTTAANGASCQVGGEFERVNPATGSSRAKA